jgi:hypothetical protein
MHGFGKQRLDRLVTQTRLPGRFDPLFESPLEQRLLFGHR